MAIYRPEQARFSFASEAGHGGYLDIATANNHGTPAATALNGAHVPGTRAIVLDDSADYAVDDYIRIEAAADPVREVRKVVKINGNTVYVDYPIGFHHATGTAVGRLASPLASLAGNSFITFLPGVYEAVQTPDIDPEFLPQWFLSTSSNRNFSRMYRGRQTFNGSLGNFILLNGYALRFPIGRVATVGTDSGTGAGTLTSSSNIGDREVVLDLTDNYANGDFIQIDTATSAEVRQIISGGGGTGAGTLVLNYPLMISHGLVSCNEVAAPFTHTINERSELDTVTWNLMMRDTGETVANDFIRRYIGGTINRMTITAEEGNVVRASWDDVQFIDLIHNQTAMTGVTGEIAKASSALIDPTQGSDADPESGIGGAIPEDAGALGDADFPLDEPYYYSQGAITLFGVALARIRNFRIDIDNGVERRDYFVDQGRDRIPTEFHEGRRQYRMTATVAMEDSLSASANTRTMWKELLLEGNYDAGFSGFDISLTFTRGTNDTITISVPPSSASDGFEAQGAFIERASHNIGAEVPVQVDLEMIFRSMTISIVDSQGVYP